MKKGLYLFTILICFVCLPKVDASSCKVSVSNSSVSPKGSVKVYVSGNDLVANIASIHASSGKISGLSDTWIENNTVSATFTAPSSGSATISVSLQAGASNGNGDKLNIGCNSVTVYVKNNTVKKEEKKPSKSGNNDLSKLEIEGYDISFKKSETSYELTVPYGTEKIKINAEKDSSKASLSGDGEKELKDAENTFEVTVKAENGDKKTYKIKVIVDTKPIEVEVDGKTYTVVKKESDLPEVSLESEIIKLNMEDEEIPALRINDLNYILIGLRNEENEVNLYQFIFDKDPEQPKEYHRYSELTQKDIKVLYLGKKVEGYKKEEVEISGKKVNAYYKEKGDYYFFYGLNLDVKEEHLYRFDKKEGTIQRWEEHETIKIGNIKLIFIILSSIFSFFVAIIIALILKIKKLKPKKEKKEKKKKKEDLKVTKVEGVEETLEDIQIEQTFIKPKKSK